MLRQCEGGNGMKENEIAIFIDTMEDYNDPWTEEEVKGSDYMNMSLDAAIADRKSCVFMRDDIFANIAIK